MIFGMVQSLDPCRLLVNQLIAFDINNKISATVAR